MKQEQIPRVVHYFWDKDKPLSYIQQVCFDSWKEFAPDFKLKRWDEHAFDMNSTAYTRYHFEQKGWVMLSDYLRFYALATEGGIYLDTDMQLVRPLDELLHHEAFVGFSKSPMRVHHVPWLETCCMGSKKSHPVFERMVDGMEEDFVRRQQVYFPNTRLGRYLRERGMMRYQEQVVSGVRVFTHEAFCPSLELPDNRSRSDYSSEEDYAKAVNPVLKENSYAIHWFRGSWWVDVEFQSPRGILSRFIQKLTRNKHLLKIDDMLSYLSLYQRLRNPLLKRFVTRDMRVKALSSKK